jgi:hypothetical protein
VGADDRGEAAGHDAGGGGIGTMMHVESDFGSSGATTMVGGSKSHGNSRRTPVFVMSAGNADVASSSPPPAKGAG